MTEVVELAKINAHLYLAALTHAAKDDIRYYLNGVSVEPCAEGGAVIVATDGRRMLAMHDANARCAESIILPEMKFAYIKLTGKREPRYLRVVRVDRAVTVIVQDEEGKELLSMPVNLVDGKYPDWRAVIPAVATVAPTSWNPDYLSALNAVSKGFDQTCWAHLAAGGGESASLFTFNVPAFVVIMPVRDETPSNRVPEWARRISE
jgi:hypothetical protein